MKERPDMLYKMASVGYFTTLKENGKHESPNYILITITSLK